MSVVLRSTGENGVVKVCLPDAYFEDASEDVCEESPSGTTSIVVCTIEGGGYELVFPFMCYSFTEDDAFWLSEVLLSACQKITKP
ncbi:hypothetical protein PspCFBP13509_16135 [Pseudomonas sp. CFBP13509]|nr:hypothetical protein PspCFBP13509_16135 [Pseudomonas sp. CFBP13509]